MSNWSLLLVACIGLAAVISFFLKERKSLTISSAFLIAFVITRIGVEFLPSPRTMYNFANDLWIVALLLFKYPKSLRANLIIFLFAGMALMYLLIYLEKIPNLTYLKTMNALAFSQIAIVYGGIINDFRRNGWRVRRWFVLHHKPLHRTIINRRRDNNDRYKLENNNRQIEQRKNGKIPIIIKKDGQEIVRYVDTTPYRSLV